MKSGLFSAVTSAFIIDIQSELKPDYEEMNNTLLELLFNATVGNIPPGQPVSLPRWTGPDPTVRQVQATLYATLCATLLAAFLATLGKQWLSRYRQTETHRSVEERSRNRERKLNGIDRWHFRSVMQFAPLVIQGSLALLCAALTQYLWGVDRTISSVIAGFASFGFILYVAFVAASVISFDCPFQTPVSLLARSVVDTAKLWLRGQPKRAVSDLTTLARGGLTVDTAPLQGLHRRVYYSSLALAWDRRYRFDARCITRMLVMSIDLDTIRLTMDFIQEVIWDAGIKTVPLGRIHGILTSCFDFTHPHTPILIPTLRDIAYLSAKAFTHIQAQQRCLPGHDGSTHVDDEWRTAARYTPLGSLGSTGDPDLESALLMVDKAFGRDVEIPWHEYRLSPAHHLWVSHLFVYHAWRDPQSKDVPVFVKYSLDPGKSPSDIVIADCLCIINVMLGTPFRVEDLAKRDKRLDPLALFYDSGTDVAPSRQMDAMLNRIFQNISRRFQGSYPTNADVSETALRVLKLITQLSTNAVATESYDLFRVIMQSEVAEETKMKASRLALCAAYRSTLAFVPPVGNPSHILDILRYHVGPLVKRKDRTRVISSVMRAIDSGYDDPTSRPWTWQIENPGEILTGFQHSPHPEAFKWWYRILWTNYGRLEPSVRDRLDDIAMNEGDKVDLKQCRIAVEKQIEKVKELGGAVSSVTLEEVYSRLTTFIYHTDKVRDDLQAFEQTHFFPPVAAVDPMADQFPPYSTGLPALGDGASQRPLTTLPFPSTRSVCTVSALNHFISYITTLPPNPPL